MHVAAVGETDRVHLVDMDKDGDLDALIGYGHDPEGKLAWYENPADPTGLWSEHLIANLVNPQSVDYADLDGDGDIDVIAGEHRLPAEDPANAAIFVMENLDGSGGSWQQHVIYIGDEHHDGAQLADFDNDGDLDVVSIGWTHNRLLVYENLGSSSTSSPLSLDDWTRTEIDATRPFLAVFVRYGDLDNDGLADVAAGGSWYRNPGPGGGTWERIAFGSPLNDVAAIHDFDGDGDLDVFGSQGSGQDDNNAFAWARNDGAGSFTVLDNIELGDGNFLQGVTVARFDTSGPLEVGISWQDATTGTQMLTVPADPSNTTWSWRRISTFGEGEDLSAGDIDGDGDLDLMLGTEWLERVSDTFWIRHVVTNRPLSGGPDRNSLVDLSGDGRLDAVVGASREGKLGELVWYEQPIDPTALWIEHSIRTDLIGGGMSLDVGDLDGDGDIDIVVGEHHLDAASQTTLRTLVLENADGIGSEWVSHIVYVGDEHHDGTQIVDIDNDGDKDIVSVGWSNSLVLLYVNGAV